MDKKTNVILKILLLAISGFSYLTLSACNQSDETPTETTSTTQYTSPYAKFTGNILASDGTPFSDAKVEVPSKSGTYKTITDANGKYSIDISPDEFKDVSPVVLIINKPGYKLLTLMYPSIEPGKTYSIPTDKNGIKPLRNNEFITEFGGKLTHLGDDSFSGSINSQFQTNASGSELASYAFDWKPEYNGKFTKANISFTLKGWQNLDNCNTISIYQIDRNKGEIIGYVESVPKFESPSDGSYRTETITLNLATGSRDNIPYYVSIRSKKCSGNGDLDDFEFTNVSVTLE